MKGLLLVLITGVFVLSGCAAAPDSEDTAAPPTTAAVPTTDPTPVTAPVTPPASTPTPEDTTVHPRIIWHDELLESVIREKIGRPEGDVFVDEVQDIASLDCRVFHDETGAFVAFGLDMQDLDLLTNLTRVNFYKHDGSSSTHTTYERDSQGRILTTTYHEDTVYDLAEVHTEFDTGGNPITGTRTRTRYYGQETEIEPPFYYEIKYMPTGKLLEKRYFEYVNGAKDFRIIEVYDYDANGLIKSKESRFPKDYIEYRIFTRDPSGKCIGVREESPDWVRTLSYEKDSDGRLHLVVKYLDEAGNVERTSICR